MGFAKMAAVRKRLCWLCKAVAVLSSIFWAAIWAAVIPVEENIRGDINWYLMMVLKLEKEYDFFHLLFVIHVALFVTELIILARQECYSSVYSSCLSEGVTVLVSVYNVAMTAYLFTSGKKVLSLVFFSLPITGTYFLSKHWLIVLLIPVFIAVYISFHNWSSSLKNSNSPLHCSPRYRCYTVAAVVALSVTVTLVTCLTVHLGCRPCVGDLPSKPGFVAHRGLTEAHVENSVVGFEAAGGVGSVAVLETDVQLSVDGELFLLHDPTLVRTTTVKDSCPEVDPLVNASSLSYKAPPCPLGNLDLAGDKSQRIPTFSQFLHVAMESGKAVMFDLYRPGDRHPWHNQYINATLDALVKSGIDQDKVYWPADEEGLWVQIHYPNLRQLAKTSKLSFDQFSQLGITAVNEEWTTSLATIREAQSRHLAVIVYVINAPSFFEYFWCAGVDSITTDYVLTFDKHDKNLLHEICTYVDVKFWKVVVFSLMYSCAGPVLIICSSATLRFLESLNASRDTTSTKAK